MTDTRSPEDRLSGVLRIAVGGVEKIVPTLSIRATREWQAALAPPARDIGDPEASEDEDDDRPADPVRLVDLSLDAILDFVVSYDRAAALGGREWLEANADPEQLHTAARQMAEVAFPFARNLPMLLAALLARSVAASNRPSSTSSPSPSGDATPDPSKTASTRSS